MGALLQGDIVSNVWYAGLATSPYTPPTWSFGMAWTQIMIFYSIFLAFLLHNSGWKKLAFPFTISWMLNIIWNPLFFRFHLVGTSLLVLLLLFTVVLFQFFNFKSINKKQRLLLMPYLVWLVIAFSLNGYVYLNN